VIYLDSCALLKLVRAEPETGALAAFIDEHRGTRWFTSEISRTELARAVRRNSRDEEGLRDELVQIDHLCDGLDVVPVSSRILSEAAAWEQPHLRTLDAIHLSTAAGLREALSAFITYDKRLAAAAEESGLPVTAPGW
jgi:predicted nucleic acid-binding protein